MSGRILVGTRKGAFIVEKSGGRWKPTLSGHPGAGVSFMARDPYTDTLWALCGHGHWGAKLSRSRDGGATWQDNPAQITYPEGARYIDGWVPGVSEGTEPPKTPTFKNATLLKLWVIAFAPGGRVWVGTIPGGLFESRDAGETFELNRGLWNHESRGGDLFAGDGNGKTHWFGTPASESGEFAPGIHSIVVDPRDPDHLMVAISTAGVLESTDGGKSWRGRNKGMLNDYLPDPAAEWGHDPHFVELCPGQPDHVWQQNHSGVFYSADAAATWNRVSAPDRGVHFGFPVAVHPQDGKTAWLVPGRGDQERMAIDGGLFVARTQDGGKTWEQQREGLPQEHAYDVVYRHALGNSGDSLAFGSTTGNLYVSENGGDSWRTVANNLPPIYSVRFA
ncbi:MAG TPA: exo-alpha-sialidase [Kofleriaceae bacterium]|nr:exo-alpha-sialidase [Kofleriaceae bacterium]